MSRIGIRPDETGMEFVKKALQNPGMEVEGIFTHFAKADEEDKASARRQLTLFRDFIRKTEKETGYRIPLCHCSNSAGIIELREADMDAVRAGIAMYGLWPSPEMAKNRVDLKPVMELKSRIVYIKDVDAGTEISYGGTYIAGEKRRIATVPAGYGDGYPRGLSNKGYVLVHGRKAPITGRICMDQFMIDVTGYRNFDWKRRKRKDYNGRTGRTVRAVPLRTCLLYWEKSSPDLFEIRKNKKNQGLFSGF